METVYLIRTYYYGHKGVFASFPYAEHIIYGVICVFMALTLLL